MTNPIFGAKFNLAKFNTYPKNGAGKKKNKKLGTVSSRSITHAAWLL